MTCPTWPKATTLRRSSASLEYQNWLWLVEPVIYLARKLWFLFCCINYWRKDWVKRGKLPEALKVIGSIFPLFNGWMKWIWIIKLVYNRIFQRQLISDVSLSPKPEIRSEKDLVKFCRHFGNFLATTVQKSAYLLEQQKWAKEEPQKQNSIIFKSRWQK